MSDEFDLGMGRSVHGQHPNSLANLKMFQPGQSGNPHGRPVLKIIRNGKKLSPSELDTKYRKKFEKISRKGATKAIQRLEQLIQSSDDDRAVVMACKELINRAIGSPTATSNVNVNQTVLHVNAIDAVRDLNARLKLAKGDPIAIEHTDTPVAEFEEITQAQKEEAVTQAAPMHGSTASTAGE